VGARAEALAFLEGYAAVDARGNEELAGAYLPRGPLQGWAHLLWVQAREFPGQQEGTVALRELGPARPVGGVNGLVWDVEIDASVTFHFDPADDAIAPFDVTRDFSRIRVARLRRGGWIVVDAVRDRVPVSATFQVFGPDFPVARDRGVKLTLVSFVSYPQWQFHLQVRSPRTEWRLRWARLVDAEGKTIAEASAITSAVQTIWPREVAEGLATFDALTTAEGLGLELTYDAGTRRTLLFELEDLLELPGQEDSAAA
jgi:hypothetical protein